MFRELDRLDAASIEALIRGDILAIRVKQYYPESLCKAASAAIQEFNPSDYYKVTENLGVMKKIGKAIFDYAENVAMIDHYYSEVKTTKEVLRNIFGGWIPLDKFKSEISALWPSGCHTESLHGREMYYGLIRVFEPGSYALPHQDMTHWDMPNCVNAQNIQKQFAVNVHLQAPEIGGQMVLFNKSIRSQDEYNEMKMPGTYGIDTGDIPHMSQISIKPSPGDLIISNSQILHSVLENKGVMPRYTTSCFMNYRSNNHPLMMFS